MNLFLYIISILILIGFIILIINIWNKLNIKVCYGTTRIVLLISSWAIKVPSCVEWRLFLWGILGNIQEAQLWNKMPNARDMMCPILFTSPGKLLIIMRRAMPVSRYDWEYLNNEWYKTAYNKSYSCRK